MASASFISDVDGTTVTFKGPVFDGRAVAIAEVMCEEFDRQIGRAGVELVQHMLDNVLQHPTGYYRSQIQTDRADGDTVITDGGVVYGPWLEGVGSRNYPVTKFEGYHTFQKAYPLLAKQAEAICLGLLRGKYIGEMNA